jgi:hypothetical protein
MRLDHSFRMDKPPDVAQTMFIRDIAPEMARDRGFLETRERPGELVFSDGAAPGRDVGGEIEESTEERIDLGTPDAPLGGDLSDPGSQTMNAWFGADDLPDLLARHIHVEFTADGTGTQVRVRGHVERDIGHALERLGTPQHWPETADLPHG